jgi:hypothetical protein
MIGDAVRKESIEELRSMRATALARAHRTTSRAQSDPARGSHYRSVARASRKFADELLERIEQMKKQSVETTDLRELAQLCDQYAEAFSDVLRRLHSEIALARQRNGGRGPSGLLTWSALERCATSRFNGTVLRSLRGSPRVAGQRTFAQQIECWLPSLTAPPNPPSPLTPPPPQAAA